ncbi:ferric reductase-like transmembrane domain-containing protein [Adlercreutzia sp. ZJ138]|uniref:ferric reductase-like transmembrane domain-containing protein n=1 Tax=Adlercreutzia sp. ZJ138 TaxID=2709405 RepID=UPI0013EDA3BA|nr:ferric reductase-like transmembrane domain-containing protein [Adlercreutzia sp. ZJ138]
MDILIAFAVACLFVAVLRHPLAHHPGVFYGLALAVDVVFLSGALGAVLPDIERELLPFLRRGIFPYALFALVMFIGVLPEGTLRSALRPVRGPLSIVAALLTVCHFGSYVPIFAKSAAAGFQTAAGSTVFSLAVAVVVILLLGILTVTSFAVVRRRMGKKLWTSVQRFAYVFFVLVTLHAVVLLLPASLAAQAWSAPVISVSVYLGILLLYAMLRIARVILGKADREKPISSSPDVALTN